MVLGRRLIPVRAATQTANDALASLPPVPRVTEDAPMADLDRPPPTQPALAPTPARTKPVAAVSPEATNPFAFAFPPAPSLSVATSLLPPPTSDSDMAITPDS